MKFRKKPIIVEAKQWNGNNLKEMTEFMGNEPHIGKAKTLWIITFEGNMMASPNDWVIKGVADEFYPCKPDIFLKTYERL